MAHTDQTEPLGSRASRALKRLVLSAIVLCLAGAVAVLLSQLNARTFRLEVDDGKLVVMKGRLFPVGSDRFQPRDPALADAYAPLDLQGSNPTQLVGVRFTERDELDRAIFSVIEGLAKSQVTSDEPRMLESGLAFVRRAERLTGLTEDQRLSLKGMKQEVAYYQARGKLEDALRQISEALTQLRLGATGTGRNSRSANQMITAVEPQAKALEDSLRAAVHSLSAPAIEKSPPPEAAKPAPPPESEPAKEQAPAPKEGASGTSGGEFPH